MKERLSGSEQRLLLTATTLAGFVIPLMSTMLNLSLLDIGKEFGVGSHDLGYVNTLFLLGSVVGMVPAARYGSIHGMRKVFFIGITGMIFSAFAIIFSPNFGFFIVMRLVTGLFASMIMVTSVSMISLSFPAEKRGWAIGISTTGVYIGLSLGPTIGGVLSDAFGWRSLFVLIAVLYLVAQASGSRFRSEMTPQEGNPMDWTGAVLWGVSVFVLMFGVVNMTENWARVMIAAGSVLFVLMAGHLVRTEFPVLNIRLFRDRTFSKAAVASFMNYGASYSLSFFLALYLQSIGGMTATQAGVFMLLQPLFQVLLTARAGAVSDRLSDKRTVPVFAASMTTVGVAMFLFLDIGTDLLYIAAMMAVLGIGIGCFGAPVTAIVVNRAPKEYRGDASGVVAVVRQTGMMTSMGIAMAAIAVIMGSTDNLGPATYGDFIEVLRFAISICFVMCLLALACCITLGREKAADGS